MHEDKDRNRYENSWLWSIDAVLAGKLNDPLREMNSISRVLASNKSHDAKENAFSDNYINALHLRLFSLEVNANRFADALGTVDRIQKLPDAEATLVRIENTIAYVNDSIASEDHIFIKVDLENTGEYFHSLARNGFTFANINGKVNTVEVRCETHREKFSVAEDFVWRIPLAWGQCQVLIKGDTKTTFDLIEVAKV